ncbi:hypothetical protein ACOJUR_10790 [Alicyclobacillus tolerans]|uniref:hypothetical protein n=1 Tax=Alicyclobacillus tolerans TaxID=90970 RepID=UPI003B802CE0
MGMGGPVSPYQYLSNVLIVSALLCVFAAGIYQLAKRLIHQMVLFDRAQGLTEDAKLETDKLLQVDKRLHNKKISLPLPYQLLWYGIAFFWLVAGFLQMQPMMFTHDFVTDILESAYQVQIPFFRPSDVALMNRWASDPVTSNVESIMIQLYIGILLILNRRNWIGFTALGASIIWGIMVWIYGEGFGNTFAAGSSFLLQGSPGGVIFYVVAAILLLLPIRYWKNVEFYRGLQWIIAIFWFIAALWQLAPINGGWNSETWKNSLSSMIQTLDPQPYWVVDGIHWFMNMSVAHTAWVNGITSGAMLLVAILAILPVRRAILLSFSLTILFLIWWFGQDFGVLGGMGTDVNSAPLVALFMLVGWTKPEVWKIEFSYLKKFFKTVHSPLVRHK